MAKATPLVREFAWREPEVCFRAVADAPFLVFLDSAREDADLGRYSFLACDPYRTIVCEKGETFVDGRREERSFFDYLQAEMARAASVRIEGLPPFQGGAAGYFGYELGALLERTPRAPGGIGAPDAALGLFDAVAAFDHRQRRAWIVSTGMPEEGAAAVSRAKARAEALLAQISGDGPALAPSFSSPFAWTSNFTRESYLDAVRRVIAYIAAGDIFQANFTQAFRAPLPQGFNPAAAYLALRRKNPAPFAAYVAAGETTLLSASPERFLLKKGNRVETRPIKGTRPRRADAAEDARLAAELLASEKDRAENIMIVDLLRNDLSRVCRPGSVATPRLLGLESYASVHHLVSTVEGVLEEGEDAVDLLRAAFPGGSITGAPKIRAMEIIAELEALARGPYCGAIGYLGFDGEMDLSITIRTMVLHGGLAMVQAGGGIVIDSDPAAEYQESFDKAAALLDLWGAATRAPKAAAR